MPNRLMVEIGANTYAVPLGGTVSQIRNVLLRVAKFHAIPLEGRTNEDVMEDLLTQIKRDLINTSRSVQREEQVLARIAEIEGVVENDNNI